VIQHQFVSTVCFYIGDSTLTEPCSIWQYSKKEEEEEVILLRLLDHYMSKVYQNLYFIIIIMEKTEAGLRGLCIREIDVKSQILVAEYYSKLGRG